MLVQTELPNWSPHYGFAENDPPEATHQFLREELERIIAELHLHPSWVMLSNGNELIYQAAGHPLLVDLNQHARTLDPTRLYTDQTGMGQLPAPGRATDYYIQS
jgi:beta-galactosidase/beta-glucuronidase